MTRFFFALFFSLVACTGWAAPASEPSLEEMVGQMLMVGFRGTGDPSDKQMAPLIMAIKHGQVGGVILFDRDAQTKKSGRNITSLKQVAALTAMLQTHAKTRLFIAVDQEGGKVRRLRPEHGMPGAPSPEAMGCKGPEDNTALWRTHGKYLAEVGINVNFAPSLDVNVNPDCPVIGALGRSYSADEEVVEAHALAVASALSVEGIIPVFKHFPGHGSSTADTHKGIADVTGTWTDKELAPYRSIAGQPRFASSSMVMAGHLVHLGLDKQGLPATLSRPMIEDLLRRKLGWTGVIITDDLQMKAIAGPYTLEETILHAIRAGVDILLFGNNLAYDPALARKIHGTIMGLVEKGAVSEERIRESYNRIMALKKQQLM